MPTPPFGTSTAIAQEVLESCLLDLTNHKQYLRIRVDFNDPYSRSMVTFQEFTISIISALEQRRAEVVDLATSGVIQELYTGFPSFFEWGAFKAWVKDATLKHPLRRTAKQHQWLQIVAAQTGRLRMDVGSVIIQATADISDWEERAYAPENLVKDPDILYFFQHKHSLRTVQEKAMASETDTECAICTNAFDNAAHAPQRAPCGHIHCADCFRNWLVQSIATTYRCPTCRTCMVCGIASCRHHSIQRDRAPPLSLPLILDRLLPVKANEKLHGLTPARYWKLREDTRPDRGLLTWIDGALARHTLEEEDPVRVRLVKDKVDVMERVTTLIVKTMVEMIKDNELVV